MYSRTPRRFADNLIGLEKRRKLAARQCPDWVIGTCVWALIPVSALVLVVLVLRAVLRAMGVLG